MTGTQSNDEEIIASRVVKPYYLYLKKNGIMFIRISADVPETVELSKQMVEIFGEMVNYRKVPLLAWHENGALPPKENRDNWAQKDACPYSAADAFIVRSLAFRLLANFYLQFNKPERPTRFFQNTKDATAWLLTFVNTKSAENTIAGSGSKQRRATR